MCAGTTYIIKKTNLNGTSDQALPSLILLSMAARVSSRSPRSPFATTGGQGCQP
jgi:hypothetical protein